MGAGTDATIGVNGNRLKPSSGYPAPVPPQQLGDNGISRSVDPRRYRNRMADRPDRPRRSEVPLSPMPAAWREPEDDGSGKPGPRPPSIRHPIGPPSGPPVVPPVVPPPVSAAPPTVRPPRPPQMVPPRLGAPNPVFLPPPYAPQPIASVVPVSSPRPVPVSAPRSRPLSPIPYPGLPLSAPPMGPGPVPEGAETHPYTGEPLSDRSSLTAGLLQLFLGAFGAGRLYTGHVAIALLQMSTTWFLFAFTLCAGLGLESPILSLFWVGLAWPVIDGIVFLGYGGKDSKGRRLR